MNPNDILMPAIIGLAFFGYVQCLARRLWLTLVLSIAVVILILRIDPFDREQALNWIGAGVLVILAVVCARLWPVPRPAAEQLPKKAKQGQPEIVIDGTNVLYWNDNAAQLDSLRLVVTALAKRGYLPIVFLDASSRHHLQDKSLDEVSFARALSLHPKRVMVCPAGTEADVFLLKFARDQGLAVVSNDRFGDRKQLAKDIKRVRGVIAKDKPIFEGL